MLDGPLWKLPVLLCAPQELFRQSLDSSCVDSVDLLFWHRRREAAPCREGALAGRDKPASNASWYVSEWASSQWMVWLFPWCQQCQQCQQSIYHLNCSESGKVGSCTLLQDLMCHIAKARASRASLWLSHQRFEKEQFVSSHLRSFVMSGAFRHERCRMTMNKEHEHAVLCSVPCHATKKTEVQLQMAAGCRTILQQQTDHVARNSVQPDTGFDALDRCCHATTFSYHLNHLNFGKFRDIWYLFDTCLILVTFCHSCHPEMWHCSTWRPKPCLASGARWASLKSRRGKRMKTDENVETCGKMWKAMILVGHDRSMIFNDNQYWKWCIWLICLFDRRLRDWNCLQWCLLKLCVWISAFHGAKKSVMQSRRKPAPIARDTYSIIYWI